MRREGWGLEVVWSYGKESWEMTVVARGGEGGRGLREEKLTLGCRRGTSKGHEGAEGKKLELRTSRTISKTDWSLSC